MNLLLSAKSPSDKFAERLSGDRHVSASSLLSTIARRSVDPDRGERRSASPHQHDGSGDSSAQVQTRDVERETEVSDYLTAHPTMPMASCSAPRSTSSDRLSCAEQLEKAALAFFKRRAAIVAPMVLSVRCFVIVLYRLGDYVVIGYLYVTRNRTNHTAYVGQSSRLDPQSVQSYLGSGDLMRQAIAEFGVDSFNKVVLGYLRTRTPSIMRRS